MIKVRFILSLLACMQSNCSAQSQTVLSAGDVAPDFELPASNGERIRLSSFRGSRNVVLVFFPKAFTGGDTVELSAYQSVVSDFHSRDTEVLGISTDPISTLKAFATQLALTFPLLSDDTKTASDYGVLLRGRGMALRVSFVIDKQGKIQFIEVGTAALKPDGTAEAIKRLQRGETPQVSKRLSPQSATAVSAGPENSAPLSIGDAAPDFNLMNTNADRVRLSDFRGKQNVVLMFLPRAFTGGDEAQLRAYETAVPQFDSIGTQLLAITTDPIGALDSFSKKLSLSFPLLSDGAGSTSAAYSVLIPGRGIADRVTFVIDKSGSIQFIEKGTLALGASNVAQAAARLDPGLVIQRSTPITEQTPVDFPITESAQSTPSMFNQILSGLTEGLKRGVDQNARIQAARRAQIEAARQPRATSQTASKQSRPIPAQVEPAKAIPRTGSCNSTSFVALVTQEMTKSDSRIRKLKMTFRVSETAHPNDYRAISQWYQPIWVNGNPPGIEQDFTVELKSGQTVATVTIVRPWPESKSSTGENIQYSQLSRLSMNNKDCQWWTPLDSRPPVGLK